MSCVYGTLFSRKQRDFKVCSKILSFYMYLTPSIQVGDSPYRKCRKCIKLCVMHMEEGQMLNILCIKQDVTTNEVV